MKFGGGHTDEGSSFSDNLNGGAYGAFRGICSERKCCWSISVHHFILPATSYCVENDRVCHRWVKKTRHDKGNESTQTRIGSTVCTRTW
jgi:hypothetical protein